jgi:hypothetical protein
VYELEKQNLEQRILEEKNRAAKMIKNFEEDIDMRNRTELNEKDEEIDCLQAQLQELQAIHQRDSTAMNHEFTLKDQLLLTKENQLQDAKERLNALENGKNSAFEKQIEYFEHQRQEFTQKIDRI